VSAFASLDDVSSGLASVQYLADAKIATSVFLSVKLEKPLLVEGPAGVGKTDLARAMAEAQGLELVRLQCYEGIDESRALYEWEYAKQLLYTQLLRDHLAELIGKKAKLDDAVDALKKTDSIFFSEHFLLARPLLHALRATKPTLLLVDEIDKADPELEAMLLEVLSDFAATIPELGTLRATLKPQVLLTSNNARELSDPLRRRCLHLTIPYPTRERELAIVRLRVPGVDDALRTAVVGAVQKIRTLDLRKAPSISEVIDWTRALGLLGRNVLDEATLQETLGVLLKHKDDATLVMQKRADVVAASRT
jgi:MoxR-like ATPase